MVWRSPHRECQFHQSVRCKQLSSCPHALPTPSRFLWKYPPTTQWQAVSLSELSRWGVFRCISRTLLQWMNRASLFVSVLGELSLWSCELSVAVSFPFAICEFGSAALAPNLNKDTTQQLSTHLHNVGTLPQQLLQILLIVFYALLPLLFIQA